MRENGRTAEAAATQDLLSELASLLLKTSSIVAVGFNPRDDGLGNILTVGGIENTDVVWRENVFAESLPVERAP